MPIPVVAAAAAGGSGAAAGGAAAAGAGGAAATGSGAAAASGSGTAAGVGARAAASNAGFGQRVARGAQTGASNAGFGQGASVGDVVKGKFEQGVSSAVQDKINNTVNSYVQKAVKLATDPLGALADVVSRVSDNVANAAQNRFIPILKDILPGALGSMLESVTKVTNAFIERGRELQMYSGELALSFAMSDVKETMADLKEGRELGPGIAKMNDGATDIWLSIREILLPIKKLIVDQLGDFLSKTGDAMSLVADVATPAVEVLTKILDVLFTIARYASPIGIGVSLLSLIKNNTDEKMDKIDDWDKFIKNAMNIKVGFKDEAFRRDRPRNRPNNMNVPLFAGI